MAALTAAKQTNLQGEPKLQHYSMKAAAKVFKGGLVMTDATGFLVAGADAAGGKCVGVATESVDNTSGANGDKQCLVAYDCVARLTGATLIQATVGANVFITDDSSVDETTVNSIKVGKLQRLVSATEGLVFVTGAADNT